MFTLGTGGHQRQWQKGGVSIYICIRMMPLPLPLPSQNRYPTHSMTMPLPLLLPLPLPLMPPQCEHPPLDTTQPIHDGKNIILPLPLPSLSVNEPLIRSHTWSHILKSITHQLYSYDMNFSMLPWGIKHNIVFFSHTFFHVKTWQRSHMALYRAASNFNIYWIH